MLDTNTCIALVNQEANFLRVVDHLDAIERDQVLVSAITVGELAYGVARSARRLANEGKLARFLAEFDVVAFDEEAAQLYGKVRQELASRGEPIGPLDTMIAGHALSLGATIVTNNMNSAASRG